MFVCVMSYPLKTINSRLFNKLNALLDSLPLFLQFKAAAAIEMIYIFEVAICKEYMQTNIQLNDIISSEKITKSNKQKTNTVAVLITVSVCVCVQVN